MMNSTYMAHITGDDDIDVSRGIGADRIRFNDDDGDITLFFEDRQDLRRLVRAVTAYLDAGGGAS